MAALPTNLYPSARSVDPPPAPDSFADATKATVNEIVNRCTTELRNEIESLHKALDDFERTSTTRAAQAKHSLESYVATINYGHGLVETIRDRLATLRQEQSRAFYDGEGNARIQDR